MKTKRILFAAFVCFFVVTHAVAQQTANIKTDKLIWTINQAQDRQTLQTKSEAYSLLTAADRIELTFGQSSRKFDIVEITGEWNDPTLTGELTYTIKFGDKVGKGILTKSNGAITFILDFSEYKGGLNQKYFITEYKKSL